MLNFYIGQVLTREDVETLRQSFYRAYSDAMDASQTIDAEQSAMHEGRADVYSELEKECTRILADAADRTFEEIYDDPDTTLEDVLDAAARANHPMLEDAYLDQQMEDMLSHGGSAYAEGMEDY